MTFEMCAFFPTLHQIKPMRRFFPIAFGAVLAIISFSFGWNSDPEIRYGKFGGDGKTAPQIELKSDHTFHYLDLTKSSNPINISGTWEIKDQEVHLLNVTQKQVMKELEIIREGKCLKARKQFAFYTLCHEE